MERLDLSCYGVEIGISDAAAAGLCDRLRDTLPPEFTGLARPGSGEIEYVVNPDTLPKTTHSGYRITRDGEEVLRTATAEQVFRWLCRSIDDTVAWSCPRMLFVHAGVVGWRGMAIVVPGRSRAGKSTLVAELVRRGAVYYSDEFAVVDDTGHVHPYRRPPALRDESLRPEDLRLIREDEPVDPLPIGLIIAGAYRPGAAWRPTVIRGARGVLPLIDSTVLARRESARMLRIAARVAPTVVTLVGLRSEAADVAGRVLDLVDDALASHALGASEKVSSELVSELSRVAELRLRSRGGLQSLPDRRLIVARYVRLTDFLAPAEHRHLLEHALAHQADFHESGVVGSEGENTLDYGFRKSRTLSGAALDEVWQTFERRLLAILPAVRKELGMSWFRLGEVERQLTVHASGGFFAPHVDTGHPIAASRRISCVYYFHASPRQFSGGELRLYDTWVTPSGSTGAGTYTTLAPVDNSIVFFPSDLFHEVCAVRSESVGFGDSRFTMTIWFRERQRPAQANGAQPLTQRYREGLFP